MAAVTCFGVLQGGCVPVWHETDARAVLPSRPDSLRLTSVEGYSQVLASPRSEADSLIGFRYEPDEGWSRVAVDRSSVARVERFDRTSRKLVSWGLALCSMVVLLVTL